MANGVFKKKDEVWLQTVQTYKDSAAAVVIKVNADGTYDLAVMRAGELSTVENVDPTTVIERKKGI